MRERCPACADPSSGVRHTCAGSGTFRADEAHASGAVEEIAEAWPYFVADLNFKIRALDEDMARHKLTDLVHQLLEDDQVEEAVISVRPYDQAAA